MPVSVSILIPCYNAERWIGQAVESALAQTWRQKEVIIVDDGSTDGSLEVIRRFSGYVHLESGPNRGGNAARNRLLELARGEWLQYLDADDYLLQDKVTGQIEFLADHPETDVVFGPVTFEHYFGGQARQELHPIPQGHDIWELLAMWYLPQTGSPLWRRSALLDVGGWKINQTCCQEHELYLRLLMAGKCFAYCPRGGAIYRQWSDETVCRKNVPEVHRRRLEIERLMEEFLAQSGQLTPQRQRAINQARFEVARNAWQYDPTLAGETMRQVRRRQPGFVPGGKAAPKHYQLLYRLLGFETVEKLAGFKRALVQGGSVPGSVAE
jgi:glycosyltransferase involved in cell wall biosynthesis